MIENGMSLNDIIAELLVFVLRMTDFPQKAKANLLSRMSAVENRTSMGCSTKLGVASLAGAFFQAREESVSQ